MFALSHLARALAIPASLMSRPPHSAALSAAAATHHQRTQQQLLAQPAWLRLLGRGATTSSSAFRRPRPIPTTLAPAALNR